jgi:hypothetical protein
LLILVVFLILKKVSSPFCAQKQAKGGNVPA